MDKLEESDPLAEAYNRGLALEKAGDIAGAEAAYREALALDPADHGGVSIRLAAMGRAEAPDRAPDAYVATLFDQNAANFDDMLVEQLGYAVPMLVPLLRDGMAGVRSSAALALSALHRRFSETGKERFILFASLSAMPMSLMKCSTKKPGSN